MAQKRISDLLVEARVFTREQLDRALAGAFADGEGRVANELLRLGLNHERQVAEALSASAGHPVLVLSESTLDLRGLALVPRHVAAQHGFLPVAIDEETITLAVADVESSPIYDQVAFACARRVERLLAVEQLLEAALHEAYEVFSQEHKLLAGIKSAHQAPHLEVVRTPVRQTPDDGAAFVASLSRHSAATPLEQLRAFGGLPVLPAPAAEPPPAVSVPGDGRPVVLVIEDDEGIRGLLTRAFQHDGYHVLESDSGDGGAAILRARKPDLVVLDAMLPGMHGFELCSRLKAAPGYSDVPVLMISAIYTGWEKAREILEEHRADAFVEKPFDVHYVRKLASELVGRPLTRRPPEGELARAIAEARAGAEAASALGDVPAALASVQRWLELDPFDPLAWVERGNVLAQERNLEGAMRAYEAAVVYDPRSFTALTNLALVYDSLGFARKASETWRRALAYAPNGEARGVIEARLRETGR